MKNTLKKIGMAWITATLVLGTATAVLADDGGSSNAPAQTNSGSAHHRRHHKAMKAAFQACAKANGITLPAKGSGEELSTADHQTIHACMKQAWESFRSCAESAGIPKPVPGERPNLTAAQKSALKQCRTQSLAQITGTGSSSSSSN